MNVSGTLHLGTSTSGWGRAIILALQSLGVDGRQIFLDCDLDPDKQGKPHIRNPVEKMQHVWRLAENSVANSTVLVERIVRYLNASSFHALGFAMYASNSIADLMNCVCVHREIISSSVNIFTKKTDNEFSFIVEDLRPVKSHITPDVFVLFILKVCRELAGAEFSPLAVEVPWEQQQYLASFNDLVGAPLIYQARHYTLRFRRADVEAPLPGANPQLAAYQDKLCRDYLDSLDENKHLPARVRVKIMQTLNDSQFSIKTVAASLNMSVRTLQRKLKADGAGFSELLEMVRRELVMEYMQNPATSATQLAYLLGFANLPGFSVSFKNWFGQTYSAYRKTDKS